MSADQEFGITQEDRTKMKAAAISGHADDLLPEGVYTTSVYGSDANTDANQPAESAYPDADDTTATREKVLNRAEFERLLIGASRLGGDTGLEAWAAIVVLGRLGLRGGELRHFDASWVDHYNSLIKIPGCDPCTAGRGGEPCGQCKQAIRQRIDHGDERPFDEIAADYWMPKSRAAVRSIPYDWSARTQEAVSMLVELHGGWPYSFSTLQRRIGDAIEAAPGIAGETTTTHGLRGTAASFHAGNGVQKEALKQMMGWRDDQTPMRYLKINGQMTSRALAEVYR